MYLHAHGAIEDLALPQQPQLTQDPRLEKHLAVPRDILALLQAEQLQRAHRRRLLTEEVRSWPLLPG